MLKLKRNLGFYNFIGGEGQEGEVSCKLVFPPNFVAKEQTNFSFDLLK